MASEHFQQAIAGAGLPAPEVIHGDGKLYRFSSNGKRMDQSGWYVLHDAALFLAQIGGRL